MVSSSDYTRGDCSIDYLHYFRYLKQQQNDSMEEVLDEKQPIGAVMEVDEPVSVLDRKTRIIGVYNPKAHLLLFRRQLCSKIYARTGI